MDSAVNLGVTMKTQAIAACVSVITVGSVCFAAEAMQKPTALTNGKAARMDSGSRLETITGCARSDTAAATPVLLPTSSDIRIALWQLRCCATWTTSAACVA